MRTVLTSLIILFVVLQYAVWLGDFGYVRLNQLRSTVSSQQDENKNLEQRNLRLQAEVVDLKQGTAALEERARSQLGMIKDGEQFYQVIDATE
ncbi:MAG: cell division protein FtsB [Arenicellales bacterium]|nr:cell division protein FtsB [Arenicellales bacterium]